MKLNRMPFLLFTIVFFGCSSLKTIKNDYSFFQVKRPKLTEIYKMENQINSVEIARDYSIHLSDQYFPEIKNFEFAQPKMFERKKFLQNPIVSYFYTKKDSIIRLIEYSWDNLEDDDIVNDVYKKNAAVFNNYFKKAGKRTIKNEPTYWQEMQVWEDEQVYVFQFILGNKKKAYRTRLIIRWKQ